MPANNAVIGALRVILGADTVAYDKGLKDAEKSLARFHAGVTKVGAAIGAGIGAAAVGLTIAIGKALNEADKLGKMAQSFGIPVEQLSALKHAADLSGVSIEEVGKAVGRMSRSMSEIAGGTVNTATHAFKALGISVTDSNGRLKTSTAVMEEVADKFAGMQDGAGKTALAMTIFGRAGANMIPLLNQGAAGLREAREEAEALGLVIDTKTAKAAEAFNDNLTRLQRVFTGMTVKVASELAPSLALLTTQMVEFSKQGGTATNVAQGVVNVIHFVAREVALATEFFRGLGRELAALWEVLKSPNLERLGTAWQAFMAEGERSRASIEAINQTFARFREEAELMAYHMTVTGSAAAKMAAPIIAGKNALDEFIKSQQKALATQRADAAAIGMAAGARERLRLVMQAETVARENNIKITAAQQVQVTLLANAIQQAVLQQQGFNLLLEAAAPHEKFRLEMQNNALALQAVGATAEQVANVQRMTAEKFGATWEQVTAGAAGGFAQLAEEMGKSNAKIATVAKALAIVEATINTYVAFTKALAATPPPLNYIAAAGVLAAGLAKVAAIKSQSIPKMATGGTLIPNAFPGQDSVLMQARVRPDERVRVERPGEGGDDVRKGGAREVTLRLVGAVPRDFVQWIADGIGEAVGDGMKIRVA